METIRRGNATEAAVLAAFIERGWAVWTPFGEGSAFDLVVGRGDALLRIQCKTGRLREGCVRFNTYSTDHGSGRGSYRGKADLFGVRLQETGAIYLIPVSEAPRNEGFFRLEPSRNNQQKKIRFAAPYEIDMWDPEELIERALAPPPGAENRCERVAWLDPALDGGCGGGQRGR